MLKNWTNIFLYHIKKNTLFSALNVLGLSIGIAGLIFATLYWNDEQSYNAWNPEKDTVCQSLTDVGNNTIWSNNLIAFLIALFPVYYLLDKWFESFAYRIDISIYPFIIGFIALLSLTLLVVLSRAYQATRVDVLKYLKYE
ncbi:hypothetical protein [Flavobacterium gawalongense]|uniref:ABC transporter permease n=1 Tax=Flavobacterium gawalongense TaxID=2594432 RepID=A0A553BEN8_9FLAO|nr:hypothetical protein [Flavobacterium gawalongense]TRW99083.1 hypothetical protein FNW33_14995 [Flavobacterium gawalongense]TRX03795.1 hypothetical protein FNW12_14930 [Flavobacterium gawalongense]TRX06724.1 hypothetical protein FNW11_14060 [Flavobacterium gawalongense]TRX07579.1 hypothetical protein FNW10_14275 [Flavobacterium gawalongense]TRX23408.1 hypothetical protein FNW38_14625 [Flavobacterium gawalongense]